MVAAVTAELKKWQHQVVTVNNWQAVADEVAMAQPDLILFGLTLPSFDGFYWIQEVRKTCQAPIIVISAADIDSNVMHAVAAGADDYLMKPFSLTVLLAKIQAQLRRHTTDQRESQVPPPKVPSCRCLNENTLSVNVSRLRTKLSSVGLDQTIRTERGVGYRMVDDHE